MYTVGNEVVQRSVLRPTLFILLINHITKIIKPPLSLGMLADGLNISVRSNNPNSSNAYFTTSF